MQTLVEAIESCNLEEIQTLIDIGTQVSASELVQAVEKKRFDILQLLASKVEVNMQLLDELFFHSSEFTREDCPRVVKVLGLEGNMCTAPLFHSIIHMNFLTAKALVKAGADVNANVGHTFSGLITDLDDYSWTPLMYTVEGGFIKELVKEDDIQDLHDNFIDFVRTLIAAGANVNFRDQNGFTPLMIAAMEQDVDFVKVLIEAGANPNSRNKKGKTALMLAKDEKLNEFGEYETAKVLMEAEAMYKVAL